MTLLSLADFRLLATLALVFSDRKLTRRYLRVEAVRQGTRTRANGLKIAAALLGTSVCWLRALALLPIGSAAHVMLVLLSYVSPLSAETAQAAGRGIVHCQAVHGMLVIVLVGVLMLDECLLVLLPCD